MPLTPRAPPKPRSKRYWTRHEKRFVAERKLEPALLPGARGRAA
jgi:hypothetical protein